MAKTFLSALAVWVALSLPAAAQTPQHMPSTAFACPGDQKVWVNIPSHIYHFQGERYYGSTKNGKFMCEMDARREGDRPTRNGQ